LAPLLFFGAVEAQAYCTNVPVGGSYTVSSSCTFSGTVDGADNGNITVNAGQTLTVSEGQTIVWSPNYSLVINGSLVIDKTNPGSSGQLKKAYIWLTDLDNDGYPSTAVAVAQNSQPAGGKRRMNLTNFTYTSALTFDYNDASASVYPGTACNGACTENKTDGTCGLATVNTDPGGYCDTITCTNYIYGWNGLNCALYAATTTHNGMCKSDGTCYTAVTDSCTGVGATSGTATCGSAGCQKASVCTAGAAKASYDTVGEVCYTSGVNACPATYACGTGYAIRTGLACDASASCVQTDSAATDCSGTCASYCSSGSCVSTNTSAGTCTRATNVRVASGGNGQCTSAVCSFPLAGWSYRKSIVIANAGSAQTNYQLKLLVGYDSADGGQVDCNSHALSTFNDLRFTTSDGSTNIDYWIESITGTYLATVWIEVPTIAASGNTTIYMYYGNAGASATSNGVNTFPFFDHFEGASLDTAKWDTAIFGTGSLTVASSILTMNLVGSTYAGTGVVSKSALSAGNYAVESYVAWELDPSEAGYSGLSTGLTDKRVQETTYYGYWNDKAASNLYTYSGVSQRLISLYDSASQTGNSGSIPLWGSNWVRITSKIDNTAKITYGIFTYGGSTYTVNSPAGATALSALYPMVHLGYYTGYHGHCDFIAVRKWASSNEPTWNSFGSEE